VRIGDFRPFLREQDVELTHHPALTDAEYRVLKSSASPLRKAGVLAHSALRAAREQRTDSLLMVQRLLLLTPLPGIDPPRHVDVYDIDDALFVGSPAEANKRFQWVKQERRRAISTMRRARLVIAANAFLADHTRALNRRVEVIPSCVDPEAQPLREHTDSDLLRIGWIGSHTTVEYLKPVLPVLARIGGLAQPVKLVVIGADTGVRADWIEHRPWSLATQSSDLADLDIGIMPLPDSPWARGKSGYKLLQYFAAGVPAVASPVGINAELVADGRGFTATSDAEWTESLLALAQSSAERRERGARARSYVEANYSYQRWAPELAALLRSLAA
jgi:glycosyltransferase involved in cell wall biosynthesis